MMDLEKVLDSWDVEPDSNDDIFVEDQEFKVTIKSGDVFINDKFVSQLCYDPDSVGYAIADYLENGYEE